MCVQTKLNIQNFVLLIYLLGIILLESEEPAYQTLTIYYYLIYPPLQLQHSLNQVPKMIHQPSQLSLTQSLAQNNNPSTLFHLQDEVLRVRKQLSNKQNEWRREKVMLLQKTELAALELQEVKHRQLQLKKVNESLSTALSKLSAQNNSSSSVSKEFKDLLQSLKRTPPASRSISGQCLNCKNKPEIVREDREKDIFRQQQIRQRVQRQLEDKYTYKLREQEAQLRRNFAAERERLEREIRQSLSDQFSKARMELDRRRRQIDELMHENEQLKRKASSIDNLNFESLHSSALYNPDSSASTSELQYVKHTPSRGNNSGYFEDYTSSNVETDLWCQLCNRTYPSNKFYEHVEQCNRGHLERNETPYSGSEGLEEEDLETDQDVDWNHNSYQDLLRRRQEIVKQLNMLNEIEHSTSSFCQGNRNSRANHNSTNKSVLKQYDSNSQSHTKKGKNNNSKRNTQMMLVISDIDKSKNNTLDRKIKGLLDSICESTTGGKQNMSVIRDPNDDEGQLCQSVGVRRAAKNTHKISR